MRWTIVERATGKGLEHHDTIRAVQRAMVILDAHEIKNGRTSGRYHVTPEIVEACPPTWAELDLPAWALVALEGA
jgi:hypothetical protein